MRKAQIAVNGTIAGTLSELESGAYQFTYEAIYKGPPVSLTMPLSKQQFNFAEFPPFFEGLLPEGVMLEALLRKYKIDRNDYFAQLVLVGQDLVGSVTVEEKK